LKNKISRCNAQNEYAIFGWLPTCLGRALCFISVFFRD
jgi:hypothetical protein